MKLDEDDPTNNNPSIHSETNNPFIHLISQFIHPFTTLIRIHTYIHSTITLLTIDLSEV